MRKLKILILAWRRRPKTEAWVRATLASGTGNGWTPSWTRWRTCCRSNTTFCPNWTGCPYCGYPSATCAPRAISKVSVIIFNNISSRIISIHKFSGTRWLPRGRLPPGAPIFFKAIPLLRSKINNNKDKSGKMFVSRALSSATKLHAPNMHIIIALSPYITIMIVSAWVTFIF